MPAEVSWEMLDKSRFFVLGAALFSGASAALYPAVVLKTRLQVAPPPQAAASAAAAAILRRDGPRGFYRGFGVSLAGTVPARAVYMAALETTKSAVGSAALRLGVAEPAANAAASAAGGVSAAVAAQVVWTPVDVVSQRLMVQTSPTAADAFRKILLADGVRGCTAASACRCSPTRHRAPRGGPPTRRRSGSSGARSAPRTTTAAGPRWPCRARAPPRRGARPRW